MLLVEEVSDLCHLQMTVRLRKKMVKFSIKDISFLTELQIVFFYHI